MAISINKVNGIIPNITASKFCSNGLISNALERSPKQDSFVSTTTSKPEIKKTSFFTNVMEKYSTFTNNINKTNVVDLDSKAAITNAKLAEDCYSSKPQGFENYKPITTINNDKNGFSATAYTDDYNNLIIAYKGTDDMKDIVSDLQMFQNKIPEQYADAKKFYEQIKEQYPNKSITLTGHSLGGSLAQLVASENKDVVSVTFAAHGIDSIIKNNEGLKDNKNTYNYVSNKDLVSSSTTHTGFTNAIHTADGTLDSHKISNFVKYLEKNKEAQA